MRAQGILGRGEGTRAGPAGGGSWLQPGHPNKGVGEEGVEMVPLALYSVSAFRVSARLSGIMAIAATVPAVAFFPFFVAHS